MSRARARTAYTGETLQQAEVQLRNQVPGMALVPDATEPEQALLEFRVLSALAARIGRHAPARFDHAPYGIRASSPTAGNLALYLTDEATTLLADAVVPRWTYAAGVTGIEGLRWRLLGRNRVSLYVPGQAAELVLHNTAAVWKRALAELSASQPDAVAVDASDNPWQPVERLAARRFDRPHAELIARGSTALRRIGLWRDAVEIDFAKALPTMADLVGPHPELLLPTRARRPAGVTVACVAQRGGTGRTTTVVNVGASLAEAGKRVLIIDLAEFNGLLDWYASDRVEQARSAEARAAMDRLIATGDWSSVAEQVITLHASDGGGRLAVLPGPVDCTQAQLRALLVAAAATSDLVLLDAPPLGAGPAAAYAAHLADAVFTCVPVNQAIFGTWETSDSDRDEAVLARDELWSWLDDAYDRYVDLAEVLRIQAQGDELVAPNEMLDNALARIGYTNEPLGDCLAALSGLDDVYELLDEDDSVTEDELTDEHRAREAAAAARVEAWREANRAPFLTQVAETGRSLFGSTWDTEHQGWIEHNAGLLDVPADSIEPDHSGERGDDDGLAEDDLVSEPDIAMEFIPYSAEEIAAELERILHESGVAPEDVGGRFLGLVPTRIGQRLVEAVRGLPESATGLLLSPGIPSDSAVQRSVSFGQLFVITEPDCPASVAIAQLADALYRRVLDAGATQR
ncbi:AAA family ATPase [Kutzneria buriramensis]|uniref:AAA family ATPase n=1 Tax=Kutzneria buriramensis TaxID=1045776 RepID=UPI000E2360B9